MLFFRSEDDLRAWCRERGVEPGPMVPVPSALAPLAGLVRLPARSRSAAANSPGEARAIFAGVGLTGNFWDPVPRQEHTP